MGLCNTSDSIKKLQKLLVDIVPRSPNNRETKESFESLSLYEQLLIYMNWASRLIRPSPRKIYTYNEYLADRERIKRNLQGINILFEKIRQGGDINAYLSDHISKYGYRPEGVKNDRWSDKDFILNTHDFHHFHLGNEIKKSKKIINRTNDIIFAHVTRDVFHVLGIFDHSVFEKTQSGGITEEYRRLTETHDKYIAKDMPQGSVYLKSMIATSGHRLLIKIHTDNIYQIIISNDKKITNKKELENWLDVEIDGLMDKNRFIWDLYFLDFSIIDTKKKIRYVLRKGIV